MSYGIHKVTPFMVQWGKILSCLWPCRKDQGTIIHLVVVCWEKLDWCGCIAVSVPLLYISCSPIHAITHFMSLLYVDIIIFSLMFMIKNIRWIWTMEYMQIYSACCDNGRISTVIWPMDSRSWTDSRNKYNSRGKMRYIRTLREHVVKNSRMFCQMRWWTQIWIR